MNVLCVDTTTDTITLGLAKGEEHFYYVGENGCKKHNSVLLPTIERFLAGKGLAITDVDVFGVVVGPGSFTGIRIGVATVNGLHVACDKPIVEITSLEVFHDGTEKYVLLDCKHGNYYAAHCAERIEYFETTEDRISRLKAPIVYLTRSEPEKILSACLRKYEGGAFAEQAKPFYMKKSSAER